MLAMVTPSPPESHLAQTLTEVAVKASSSLTVQHSDVNSLRWSKTSGAVSAKESFPSPPEYSSKSCVESSVESGGKSSSEISGDRSSPKGA